MNNVDIIDIVYFKKIRVDSDGIKSETKMINKYSLDIRYRNYMINTKHNLNPDRPRSRSC